MEEQLQRYEKELWFYWEREVQLVRENEKLKSENEEMRKELRELKGVVEKVEENVELKMRENEERMEERMGEQMGKQMEVMMEQVRERMKVCVGEGAVGGGPSASSKVVALKEKTKVSDFEVVGSIGKGGSGGNEERRGERKDERKSKSDVKSEKTKVQDESESDQEWVKVSKKKNKKSLIKDKNISAELDSLYSNEEEVAKKELSSEDDSESGIEEVYKIVYMREVPSVKSMMSMVGGKYVNFSENMSNHYGA
ncbi:golgin subfamily A member 6-like protein 7 [Macrobrachium nipponense]|uniref:golgin subfamily A member 6-like protein 7 n=1 Tax=Macrobrachium nipponense TaxID=159736 RepID=UPI0030C86E06